MSNAIWSLTRPADIPEGHIHQSDLHFRGWTTELIRSELRPNAVRTETVNSSAISPLWYPPAAVEAAEAGAAYLAHQAAVAAAEREAAVAGQERREHARARRAASAPAVAARNTRMARLDPELVERRGRRLYVRCGYESKLGVALRAMGASWDRDEKSLWVGTGKADKLADLLAARHERKQRVADTLAAGLWVNIPIGCGEIRSRAEALGAIWDPEWKRWAMPDRASYDEVAALLAAVVRREAAAAQRVHTLVERLFSASTPNDGWTNIAPADRAGTIRSGHGGGWTDCSQVVLTRDGRVLAQHPGWYDDWRCTERVFTDADTIAEVSDIIAGGDRRLSDYTITGAES